jgi:hypothetical protein
VRTDIHFSVANDKDLGGLHQLQVLSYEYEQKLRELVQSGVSLEKIAAVLERSRGSARENEVSQISCC